MGTCCFRAAREAGADEVVAGGNRRHQHQTSPVGAFVGNKLICTKAPTWVAEAPITSGQLRSKRDAFWDTAPSYGGKPEIWQALRAAAETDDVATAQAFVDAVNVTLPSGNLTLVYDELGNKYEIPPYCLSDPSNLVQESALNMDQLSGGEASSAAGVSSSAEEQIMLRLRLSTTNEDLEWKGPISSTGADLKNFVQLHKSIPRERLRCLFGGKIITDNLSLKVAKVPAEVVVIMAVFDEPPSSP